MTKHSAEWWAKMETMHGGGEPARSVPDGEQSVETGDLHTGWHYDKVCLGVGPVRLRFDKAEANRLAAKLLALTAEPVYRRSDCGCDASGPAATRTDEDSPVGDHTDEGEIAPQRSVQGLDFEWE